jgi:uncharacterized protein YbjT (DUF2867 family)
MREPKKKMVSDHTIKGAIVLVDGATGYLGSHVVADLIRNDLRVRCLVREGAQKDDINFLSGLGAEIVQADLLRDSSKAFDAFKGATAAVHLIGSIAPKRGETFENLHVEPTSNFAALCQKASVPKAIMVTALGTAANAKSQYHRSKFQAESILRESKVPAIFLRPSLLVGRTSGHRDSKLVKRYCDLIQTKKTIPLIGGGTNRIQPLFIDDMVAAVRQAIQVQAGGVGNDARAYDLAGPNSMTMAEFVKSLMKVIGIERNLVSIPVPIAKLIAMLAEKNQEVPIISQDQVTLATTDNVCQNNHIETIFNIKPSHINIAFRCYGPGKESETLSARAR